MIRCKSPFKQELLSSVVYVVCGLLPQVIHSEPASWATRGLVEELVVRQSPLLDLLADRLTEGPSPLLLEAAQSLEGHKLARQVAREVRGLGTEARGMLEEVVKAGEGKLKTDRFGKVFLSGIRGLFPKIGPM